MHFVASGLKRMAGRRKCHYFPSIGHCGNLIGHIGYLLDIDGFFGDGATMSDAEIPLANAVGAAKSVENAGNFGRVRLKVYSAVALVASIGWIYLALMVADMAPRMDMASLGPGMQFFNEFNVFKGLSEEARAALAVLCLPSGSETFGMPSIGAWAGIDFAIVLLMWVMMTLAMMLPSAAPMLATFAERTEIAMQKGVSARAVTILALGYLTMWMGYSFVAATGQWLLTEARALSPVMAPATMILTGTTLVGAGLYQFTPSKRACLTRCQHPAPYFSTRQPHSLLAVYKLGLEQGLFCLGCCWALMAVMFAVGVMNVIWIAALGFLMAIEKLVLNPLLPRAIGAFLLLWGLIILAASPGGQAILFN